MFTNDQNWATYFLVLDSVQDDDLFKKTEQLYNKKLFSYKTPLSEYILPFFICLICFVQNVQILIEKGKTG